MDADDASTAKLVWLDPFTSAMRAFALKDGAQASIGRAASNDIQITEGHVSRAHAIVSCLGGGYRITDLDSANGTFVNGARIHGEARLAIGDDIHLFVTLMKLVAVDAHLSDAEAAELVALVAGDRASLSVVGGPQRGHVFALLNEEPVIGRATPRANWEIALQDPTVSRPHAMLVRDERVWKLFDLGSVNGTAVNNRPVTGGVARALQDGDRIMFGATRMAFRLGYPPPAEPAIQDESEAQ